MEMPQKSPETSFLHSISLKTPLGEMIAIANDEALLLLQFKDCRNLENQIKRLRYKTLSAIVPGYVAPLRLIEKELTEFFKGERTHFQTPFRMLGSAFQIKIWEELLKIPHGEVRSYSEIAILAGNPAATRAVGNANGANQLAIVIPCHRVINMTGKLGGYAGGVEKKVWLLDLEKKKMHAG